MTTNMRTTILHLTAIFTFSVRAIQMLPVKRISIATWTVNFSSIAESTASTAALQQQGPAIELGLEYLQSLYGHVFNFTHEFLYDSSRHSTALLSDDAEVFTARFYYGADHDSDGMAMISPCSREQVQAAHISKELDLLVMCSVGNGLHFKDYPQRISTSIYPGSAILRFLTLTFDQYNWTNIAALIDNDTYNREPFHKGMHEIFTENFNSNDTRYRNIRYSAFACNASSGNAEVEVTLRKISETNRIVFIFGSGMAARKFMMTADKLLMTDGEYVFIMMTLQKAGLGGDATNDPSWLVTEKNEKLGIPYQVFASKAVLLLSFVLSYTEESVGSVRKRLFEIAAAKYNFVYPRHEIPILLYATYEEHLLYGIVLNETYATTGRILQGTELASHFLNRTFNIPTGEIFINDEGERMCDVLGDMVDESGTFTTVIRYDHKANKLVNKKKAISQFWPGGMWPPKNEPNCGYLKNRCTDSRYTNLVATATSAGFGCAILVLLALVIVRMRWQWLDLNSVWWKVTADTLGKDEEKGSLSSRRPIFRHMGAEADSDVKRKTGRLVRLVSGETAWRTPVTTTHTQTRLHITADLLKLLLSIKHIRHPNINPFIGITTESVPLYIVEAYRSRGSLDDVLDEIKIDVDMAFSLLLDLTLKYLSFHFAISHHVHMPTYDHPTRFPGAQTGMMYIYDSPLKFHGNMRSSKCLLDNQMGLKISDVANEQLVQLLSPVLRRRTSSNVFYAGHSYDEYFWTAPEVLRGDPADAKSDVYSYAIISYQILAVRSEPYDVMDFSNQEIIRSIRRVSTTPFRPHLEFDPNHFAHTLTDLHRLIVNCWDDEPSVRPSWSHIQQVLGKSMQSEGIAESKSLFDRVMMRLQSYASTLEDTVEQRTQQLMEERMRCDVILGEMLPRTTIELLRTGQAIEPEYFYQATIYFSDLVGFVDFVERTNPLAVMEFLHVVYSRFDEVLSAFDVYKVETIGDSYMVASGLPIRNGQVHVAQICRMAIALQTIFPQLYSASKDRGKLSLRVGIHTGPVVAGVVGHKTPRYCLFGDTINTASRMQSHGLPSRIHVSEPVAAVAESVGFLLKPRGEIKIKGKGEVLTFWLEREIGVFSDNQFPKSDA